MCDTKIHAAMPNPPLCKGDSGHSFDLHETKPYTGPRFNLSNLKRVNVRPVQIEGVFDLGIAIPKEFSWRQSGGNKIENGGRDQGRCGGCWAFSTSSALGDRYALKYNIKAPMPSAINLITCGTIVPGEQGCCGGNVQVAAEYLVSNGIKLEKCWPTSQFIHDAVSIAPGCLNKLNSDCCLYCCENEFAKPVFTVKKGSVRPLVAMKNGKIDSEGTIALIQKDIMANGPVPTSFLVPPGFEAWWNRRQRTEIYTPSAPPTKNGHSVVIGGWGEDENGTRYWEIRNSWGLPGWCKFAMSTSTQAEFRCYIDVPEIIDNTWTGGAVTFKPGPLAEYTFEKGDGSSPVAVLDDEDEEAGGRGVLGEIDFSQISNFFKEHFHILIPVGIIFLLIFVVIIVFM